jgi:hypothetical protein
MFITSVNDTGNKFIAGVIETDELSLSHIFSDRRSLIPVINLSVVTTTPAINLLLVTLTPAIRVHGVSMEVSFHGCSN